LKDERSHCDAKDNQIESDWKIRCGF